MCFVLLDVVLPSLLSGAKLRALRGNMVSPAFGACKCACWRSALWSADASVSSARFPVFPAALSDVRC